jgi:serine protease Do
VTGFGRRGAALLLAGWAIAGASRLPARAQAPAPASAAEPGAVPPAAAEETQALVARALAAVYPALVNITAVTRHFAEGRAMRFPSAGSGVIVDDAGHVLTNFHVAGNSTRLRCTLTSGEVLDADVVAHDPVTDLSVLKLRLAAGAKPPFRPAPLAVDAILAVGDPVLAMGNPFALSSSVTLGIVSNPRRVFTDFAASEIPEMDLGDGETTGVFTQWIQHDALILPGNSGGPLVDLQGRVVGINELGGGGIGFAIPARVAADVLRRALAPHGLHRGFLGFLVLPVTKLGREQGALVSAVLPDSPAGQAGLEAGDLLLSVAGRPVAVRFFEQVPELYERIADLAPGGEVELEVERGGERRVLRARVAEMERSRGDEGEFRALGLSAQELTGPMALARNLRVRRGLVISGLRPGQAAAAAHPQLQPGDVLVAVDGRPVSTLEELERAIEAATGNDLLLEMLRGEERLLSVAHLPEGRAGRWGGELPKAWLGVRTQVLVPQLAAALGEAGRTGFRITEVYPWTKAAEAGLAIGDLVLAIDGEPFDAARPQDAEDLRRAVEERPIGGIARLAVRRGAEDRVVEVKLEARPTGADEARRTRQDDLELAVREVTFLDRIEQHWERDQRGVLVTDATSGGWAHMAGLRTGDLIVKVGETEVPDVEGFERAMRAVVERRPKVVPLFLRRGPRTHFVFLEPEWKDLTGGPTS